MRRGAIDTLMASAPDGTLIARQANLHATRVAYFADGRKAAGRFAAIHVASCACGWTGDARARLATAERDAARHEDREPARTIYPAAFPTAQSQSEDTK